MVKINIFALLLAYLSFLIYFISEGDKLGLTLPIDFELLIISLPLSFFLGLLSIIKGSSLIVSGKKAMGRVSIICGIATWIVLSTFPLALIIRLGILLSSSPNIDSFLGDNILLVFNFVFLVFILVLIYRTIKKEKV